MEQIELGDKVRCKYSGFEGIVVADCRFINGCVQYSVLPKCKDKNEPPKEEQIDAQSLEIIEKHKPVVVEEENGGPNRRGIRQRGF